MFAAAGRVASESVDNIRTIFGLGAQYTFMDKYGSPSLPRCYSFVCAETHLRTPLPCTHPMSSWTCDSSPDPFVLSACLLTRCHALAHSLHIRFSS